MQQVEDGEAEETRRCKQRYLFSEAELTIRTPALLMAAATVNIPAIAMNVGPMLNGRFTFARAPADPRLFRQQSRWIWHCSMGRS